MANERPSLLARLRAWWRADADADAARIAAAERSVDLWQCRLEDGLAVYHSGRWVKIPLCHDGPSY